MEKVYLLLTEGEISIHDDRHLTQPWGILGGAPGARSEKILVKSDGGEERLPSKVDNVKVYPGDRIIYRTAGGGGWGDPLERHPKAVRNDVARRLVSLDKARSAYGVVLAGAGFALDEKATKDVRDQLKKSRKEVPLFDFGDRPNSNGHHSG